MINDKLLMVRTIRQLTGALELLKRTQTEMGTRETTEKVREQEGCVKVKEKEEMVQPNVVLNRMNVISNK